MSRDGVCLVGYGETPYTRPKGKSKPLIVYLAEAISMALDNAGIKKRDVDGLAFNIGAEAPDCASMCEWLGFELSWLLRTDCGGAGGVVAARRAADAIQSGQADVIVCIGGAARTFGPERSSGQAGGKVRYGFESYQMDNFALPFAFAGPTTLFALIQRRYMEKYGLTPEQTGKIAISQRKNAELNENAFFRSPMTMEEYLNSRIINYPIRLLDCVAPVSGAAAYVIASERKAKQLTKHPIYLVSDYEKVNYQVGIKGGDRTGTGFEALPEKLFTDVKREEIDVVEAYDAFTIVVIVSLEGLGFFERGKAGEFIDSHDFTFSGDFPLNTGGGELSCGQAGGAGSYLHIAEAIRQLKGEAGARQVKGAKTCLVSAPGIPTGDVPLGYTSAIILQRR